jgi:bifunctional non-homologous end joining protein LigD
VIDPKLSRANSAVKRRAFAVYEHLQPTLHYDLELELAGRVLRWTVPMASLNEAPEQALAVQTKDHPVQFAKFNGVLEAGDSRAVEESPKPAAWDQGTWQARDDAWRGFQKGHLQCQMFGDRLRGEWRLVRLGSGASWLLFKATGA